jgi:hypothetical protein
MAYLIHGWGNALWFGRWWLGVFLVLTIAFSGCKSSGVGEDGLRANGLAEPARQARARAESGAAKDSKAADDPWMSEKAQTISRDLQ